MELKVYRTQARAKLPTRAHDGDAGMDFTTVRKRAPPQVNQSIQVKHFFLEQELKQKFQGYVRNKE